MDCLIVSFTNHLDYLVKMTKRMGYPYFASLRDDSMYKAKLRSCSKRSSILYVKTHAIQYDGYKDNDPSTHLAKGLETEHSPWLDRDSVYYNDTVFFPSDLPANLSCKFVFIDACYSADKGLIQEKLQAFLRSSPEKFGVLKKDQKDKYQGVYLGFTDEFDAGCMARFARFFFEQAHIIDPTTQKPQSVYNAALEAFKISDGITAPFYNPGLKGFDTFGDDSILIDNTPGIQKKDIAINDHFISFWANDVEYLKEKAGQ